MERVEITRFMNIDMKTPVTVECLKMYTVLGISFLCGMN
jgi:hypothetical protein